ncbi:MAG: isochorismate synthase [Candidatus Zixiibacteriota bacterium]|nr:MAG: isochorismate synthase [candidate division Zixibacteria bacterium]
MTQASLRQSGIQQASERLIAILRDACNSQSEPATETASILRFETSVDTCNPLAWLAAHNGQPAIYWRDRDGICETAGLEVADVITVSESVDFSRVMSDIHARLRNATGTVRYFGGFRFDAPHGSDNCHEAWQPFGTARFVLPRFELTRNQAGWKLACNVLSDEMNRESVDKIALLLENVASTSAQVSLQNSAFGKRHDNPGKEQWNRTIQSALDMLAEGQTSKIVLARQSGMEFTSQLNPWVLLQRLRDASVRCSLFGIQPDRQTACIGATPERLYRRNGNLIESEAVAGTRPRGDNEAHDIELQNALCHSDKDIREHRFVVDSLRDSLETFCSKLNMSNGPEILKLASVQHLRTTFSGQLKEGIGDAELLASLHPTPAVGGYPKENARREISRLEHFDRGWYSGPIGWVSTNAAEFAVAIRSGLVHNNRLTLFSGAGIVEGSTPDNEWDEIETKMSHFLKAVTDS